MKHLFCHGFYLVWLVHQLEIVKSFQGERRENGCFSNCWPNYAWPLTCCPPILPWQSCTGCLFNTEGVAGYVTRGTRAGSDPRQMKSVSHLLKGCHLSYPCLAEPALYRDLLYYSAGLIFLFMTTLPWRPSISLQAWRMTLTEWYFIVIYNSQLQTQTGLVS